MERNKVKNEALSDRIVDFLALLDQVKAIFFSPSRALRRSLNCEKPSQSLSKDHEDVMTSPSSSMMAQSCLNFEMSIPTKYIGFLLFEISALLFATGNLSMDSRKNETSKR